MLWQGSLSVASSDRSCREYFADLRVVAKICSHGISKFLYCPQKLCKIWKIFNCKYDIIKLNTGSVPLSENTKGEKN